MGYVVAVEVEPAGVDGGPVGRGVRSTGQEVFQPFFFFTACFLLFFQYEKFEQSAKADMLFYTT